MTTVEMNKRSREIRWEKKDTLKECRLCTKPALLPAKNCANHQVLARLNILKYKYGISFSDYQEMVERYGGRCYICKQKPKVTGLSKNNPTKISTALHVDHNHTTNKVRGLLCYDCNAGIGHLKESPEIFANALLYLKG